MGINALTLLIMMFIGFKVINLTRCGNFKLLLLVILMNVSFIVDIVLRLYLVSDAKQSIKDEHYERDLSTYWSLYLSDNIIFMLVVLVNTNNWGFHAMRIKELSLF